VDPLEKETTFPYTRAQRAVSDSLYLNIMLLILSASISSVRLLFVVVNKRTKRFFPFPLAVVKPMSNDGYTLKNLGANMHSGA